MKELAIGNYETVTKLTPALFAAAASNVESLVLYYENTHPYSSPIDLEQHLQALFADVNVSRRPLEKLYMYTDLPFSVTDDLALFSTAINRLEIVSFVYNLEDEQINAILGEIVKGDSKLKRLEMPYEKQVCLQDPDLRRQAEEKIGVAEHVSLDDMASDLLRQADQKMGDVCGSWISILSSNFCVVRGSKPIKCSNDERDV